MTDAHAVARRIEMPAAGRYSLDPARSLVTLRTRLFGVHSLTATMSIADGQIDFHQDPPHATVTAAVSAASFRTDNPRRDDDIRSPRFLHAGEYPDLSYRAGTLSRDRDHWMLTGELTVRNVTRPVTLQIDSVRQIGHGFRAHATARVNRVDFGLTRVQWMGGRIFEIELTVVTNPQ